MSSIHNEIKQNRLGLLLAISGATLFAFKPVLIKLIYVHQVETVTILAWRMLFALPFYLVIGAIVLYQKRNIPSHQLNIILKAAMLGILGYYCASFADLYGLQFVSTQLGRMILFTFPTIVTLLGWWLLKQPVSNQTWLALIISYIGIAFIFIYDLRFYGSNVIAGSIWIFASAVFFSLFLVFSKPLITELGSRLFTSIAMSSAALMVFMHYIISNYSLQTNQLFLDIPNNEALLLILCLSILSTVIPSFLISSAIQRIGSSRTSIVGCIGPIITAGFAVALLGEHFTVYHLIGMTLVVTAITISSFNTTKTKVN